MFEKRTTAKSPAKASQLRFPPTHVPAIGLVCAAGDRPYALLGAVGANLSCAVPHPVLTVANSEEEEAAALFAPVSGLETQLGREERIAELALYALGTALDECPDILSGQKVLVSTWLPPMAKEDVSDFEALLREEIPALENATLRFLVGEEGVIAALESLCAELAEGAWDAVIFGGADSLVDIEHCRELLRQGRLMAPHCTEGVFPGEAAAYLVLRADPAVENSTKPCATIVAAAQAPELHAGQGWDTKMDGLAQALTEAADRSGTRFSEVEEMVLTLSTETANQLEWHQTLMRLWPPVGEMNPGESPIDPQILRLHPTLGELGAATLPLALALGCARFEFEHPRRASILVGYGKGELPLRGAVCLRSPE
jgi:3-oxoacyl-[acyl-carrier-protein] synthase-1